MKEDFVAKLIYETGNSVFDSTDTDPKSVCQKYLLEEFYSSFLLMMVKKLN